MRNKLVIATIILSALCAPRLAFTDTARDELLRINDEINKKKDQISSLKTKINSYQSKINELQGASFSLENEVAILDNHIAKIILDTEATQAGIEETGLEINQLDQQIAIDNSRLEANRGMLADLIRKLDHEDDRSMLETLLLQDNLSAIFNRAKYLEDVQGDLLKTVKEVQAAKANLEESRGERIAKDVELRKYKDNLLIQQIKLQDDRTAKLVLSEQTKDSENRFQALVAGLRDEQGDIATDVGELEQKARARLKQNDKFPVGETVLSWPVPEHRVTTNFHDPDYPFRRIFEHPGIDIRAAQGTSVRAAAPSYVLKVHDGGYGYSYVILLHQNGVSTLYGHLSRITVEADTYLERGDQVGLSGAMPGTRGAGPFTTGPHLHFEVRSNGLPVNPLEYLTE